MEELNQEESKQYLTIVQKGNMDDMFDWAYALGGKKAIENIQEEMEKFNKGFNYKK